MISRSQRTGFTLVEVMIVVVIMAILAATVIPQFTSSSDDARESTAIFNLHTVRSQIQLYRAEHRGGLPTLDGTNNTIPELLTTTDESGSTAGSDYGPYLQDIPENPFTGSNKVQAGTGPTPTATGDADAGWLYEASTGKIWLDHADYVTQ